MKHASLLLACWFLLADAAKIRTAHGTVGTPVVTPKPYAKLPGLGWCVDGQMNEGKARSLWGNVDCYAIQNKCDVDPNCVAYACSALKKVGVIYSNSAEACHHGCDIEHWIEDPTKIMYASWALPQALWKEASCYLVDKPAIVVVKLILEGSSYHTAKKYPAELEHLKILGYGLHSVATIVQPKEIQISLPEPATTSGSTSTDPMVVEAIYNCKTSQVQSVVQGIYSDDAENKLTSFIPEGVPGVPKDFVKVRIITTTSYDSISGNFSSLSLVAGDKLKYSVPGVTPGFVVATTTTTTMSSKRPVTTPAPLLATQAPSPKKAAIPDEVDAALWDGQTFYFRGGSFCFKVIPGDSVSRMDWKAGTDCDGETWKKRADLLLGNLVLLGRDPRESYSKVYVDGADCGGGKRETTVHFMETANSLPKLTYTEPVTCKGRLEYQLPLAWRMLSQSETESVFNEVPGEVDALQGKFQIPTVYGDKTICMGIDLNAKVIGADTEPADNGKVKLIGSDLVCDLDDSWKVYPKAQKIGVPVVSYGNFGYSRYAQIYSSGELACPTGGTYVVEMHFGKSTKPAPEVIMKEKSGCVLLMDVELPSGWEHSIRPSPTLYDKSGHQQEEEE